jgi:hypothetical protein
MEIGGLWRLGGAKENEGEPDILAAQRGRNPSYKKNVDKAFGTVPAHSIPCFRAFVPLPVVAASRGIDDGRVSFERRPP